MTWGGTGGAIFLWWAEVGRWQPLSAAATSALLVAGIELGLSKLALHFLERGVGYVECRESTMVAALYGTYGKVCAQLGFEIEKLGRHLSQLDRVLGQY